MLPLLVCEKVCGKEHKSPQWLLRNRGQFHVFLEEIMYCNFESKPRYKYLEIWYRWHKTLDTLQLKKIRSDFLNYSLLLEKMFEYFIICWIAINLVHTLRQKSWRRPSELWSMISTEAIERIYGGDTRILGKTSGLVQTTQTFFIQHAPKEFQSSLSHSKGMAICNKSWVLLF